MYGVLQLEAILHPLGRISPNLPQMVFRIIHNCLHPRVFHRLAELVLVLYHLDSLQVVQQMESDRCLRLWRILPVLLLRQVPSKPLLRAWAKMETRLPTCYQDSALAQCHNEASKAEIMSVEAVPLSDLRYSLPTGQADESADQLLQALPASAPTRSALQPKQHFLEKETTKTTCRCVHWTTWVLQTLPNLHTLRWQILSLLILPI